MNRFLTILLIVCVGFGFGCAKKRAKDVIATVNNKAITVAMVDEKIEKLPQYYQPFATQHKRELIEEMIIEELLFVQAKKRKLHRDPALRKEGLVERFEPAPGRFGVAPASVRPSDHWCLSAFVNMATPERCPR